MAIVLYEGFNFSTTDTPKIDNNYWSSNNLAGIIYGDGRTDNEIILPNYSYTDPSPTITELRLSNFPNPLSTNSCFAMGVSHKEWSLTTQYQQGSLYPLPHRSKYAEFRNASNNLVLSFNFIRTSYQGVASMGLEVVQGGNVVTVYDFSSYSGKSWTIQDYTQTIVITSRIYLEFFIDANLGKMSVRVSQDGGTVHGYLLNTNNQQETTITPFASLGSATWFAKNNALGQYFSMDDFYFSRGNNATECYLGANTKIYRLNLTGNGSLLQWIPNNTSQQFSNLNNADGDSSYIYSSINSSGDTSIFQLANLPTNPSNVSIVVKPINIVRKTGDSNVKFTNVMNSGSGPVFNLGSEQVVSSNSYNITSELISVNPATGNPWTVSDINNMQIGIKNLGSAT